MSTPSPLTVRIPPGSTPTYQGSQSRSATPLSAGSVSPAVVTPQRIFIGNITINGPTGPEQRGVYLFLVNEENEEVDLPPGLSFDLFKAKKACESVFQSFVTEMENSEGTNFSEVKSVLNKGCIDYSGAVIRRSGKAISLWEEFTKAIERHHHTAIVLGHFNEDSSAGAAEGSS